VYHNPDYRWTATYETAKGSHYEIDGTDIEECPVSYISSLSAELAGSIDIMNQVREATGENPLPPVIEWPVRLLDASRLVNVERIKEHNSRLEAEHEERER